jgi:hypothetical protein
VAPSLVECVKRAAMRFNGPEGGLILTPGDVVTIHIEAS